MNMKKQENVFQPDVEIHFRQEPMSSEQLKELFGIDLLDPGPDVKRSPRANFLYIKELNALVQEDLLPDLALCSAKECEPPYGGKESCEFYQNGHCTASLVNE